MNEGEARGVLSILFAGARVSRRPAAAVARRMSVKKRRSRCGIFLQFKDFSRANTSTCSRARAGSRTSSSATALLALEDRTLAMIFENPRRARDCRSKRHASARRRRDLLYTRDTQLGRGEPVEDAGQVISRMCDLG